MKNTDNEYRIIVQNKQTIDGETDVIEETASGQYHIKNGKQYIMYKTENEGDITSCMIKLDGNEIQIKRTGSINSLMVYRTGERRNFAYNLPYGTVEMELETERVISNLDENG